MINLSEFERGYITAALWLLDDDPGPGDWEHHAPAWFENLAPETIATMQADCLNFTSRAGVARAIEGQESHAGHDFWLTRNGHGAGFWDGDWREPNASMLDKIANSFAEIDLYFGDDGKIYQ